MRKLVRATCKRKSGDSDGTEDAAGKSAAVRGARREAWKAKVSVSVELAVHVFTHVMLLAAFPRPSSRHVYSAGRGTRPRAADLKDFRLLFKKRDGSGNWSLHTPPLQDSPEK